MASKSFNKVIPVKSLVNKDLFWLIVFNGIMFVNFFKSFHHVVTIVGHNGS